MKGTAYMLQATLILLWWLGISVSSDFFNAFRFPEASSSEFSSFLILDLIIIAGLSIFRGYKTSKIIEYAILAGFGLALMYCINKSVKTGGGYLLTIIITLGLFYNLFLVFQKHTFRASTSNNIFINGFKTLIQITCIWSTTLIIFPWIILKAFGKEVIFSSAPLFYSGLTLLSMSSMLGLISAYTMVVNGNGTPLPIDQTNRLVIKGTYRFVRNPMAIAGIGQGIGVSMIVGSIHILVYAILGALLWQVVVRPVEEKDMLERFGDEYKLYQSKVKCWLP